MTMKDSEKLTKVNTPKSWGSGEWNPLEARRSDASLSRCWSACSLGEALSWVLFSTPRGAAIPSQAWIGTTYRRTWVTRTSTTRSSTWLLTRSSLDSPLLTHLRQNSRRWLTTSTCLQRIHSDFHSILASSTSRASLTPLTDGLFLFTTSLKQDLISTLTCGQTQSIQILERLLISSWSIQKVETPGWTPKGEVSFTWTNLLGLASTSKAKRSSVLEKEWNHSDLRKGRAIIQAGHEVRILCWT